MHLHILGICGTFMGGLAALAREAGHTVTGCDAGVYPPMSDQLRALGIELIEGFDASQMALKPDLFVIGNVVSRARKPDGTPKFPLMEAILDAGAPYTSGPQWLAEHVLAGRHVLAVAGTHGKTTTTSMLAWVLEAAGLAPGFLVGGVPLNFGISALPAVDGYDGKRGLPYASWGIGISETSEHKAEAWKLVSYLMSPEVNGKLVSIANAFPGNVNATPDFSKSDPLFAEAFKIYQSGKLANEFVGLPVAEDLMRALNVEVQKMFDGQQTPAEAAAASAAAARSTRSASAWR